MIDYTQLKTLLVEQGIADTVPATDAADLLNAPSVSRYRAVSGAELRPLAPGHGLLGKLRSSMATFDGGDALTTAQVRDACEVALMLFTDRESQLNLNNPAEAGLLTLLVAVGIIPSAARDQVMAVATELVSPAQAAADKLGYSGEISGSHVINARAQP